MHITLETDYAIRIIDKLAKAKKNNMPRMDAKTISENTDVPLRFALKILHKLVTGKMISSFKGLNGGYELNRELNEISLYDVIELVEGTYRFSRCLNSEYACTCNNRDELPCAYQKVFGEISARVCDELKQQTFDKFVK